MSVGTQIKLKEVIEDQSDSIRESLNGAVLTVEKIITPDSFEVGNLEEFKAYIRNGIGSEVKPKLDMNFKTFNDVFS